MKLVLDELLDCMKKLIGNAFESEERLELSRGDGQGGGRSEGADHRKRDEGNQNTQIQQSQEELEKTSDQSHRHGKTGVAYGRKEGEEESRRKVGGRGEK